MTTKKLTLRQKILVAGTLFGMFFGAGNLIFPVHLGQMAGRNALPAIIGFIITAVGIPILGVAAIGITHSDGLQTLSGKVGKGYGIFFTCLLYLTIGPLFAIPRCATVSFTTGITPLLGADSPERLYLLLFSAVFFAFVLFFSLRPGKITVWIGKIINPLFLFFFAVLMLAALLAPGAAVSAVEPVEAYRSDAFFPALIEGYGTMDAIAGLAFGIVVIDVIRRMGVDNDDAIAEDVLSSGLLTGALMALIYVVSIVVGAQSRGLFELSENGGIALTQIAGHYLGGVGLFILAFTITFACLKTSIGLVTACAETFSKMTNGKISYRSWAILFTVFSFAVSNIGLSAIIEYSIPMLMLIYPPAIALILLAFLGKFFAHDRTVYIATMIGTWAAAIFDCMKTLPAPVQAALHLDAPIAFAAAHLPLFDKNLGWLLPAVIGFAAGMAIRASRRQTPAALS
ncbi:MAG: branched-chain amino acid transport system II carrier protein [Firmicutes bacterium]|nr:branched-chain amino acid transport system II carrier protein [Bacillota bacterium]